MIKKMVHRLFLTGFVAFFSSLPLMAQPKVEMVPFGDMDQWVDRQIKESGIIGGKYEECICDRSDECGQGRSGV